MKLSRLLPLALFVITPLAACASTSPAQRYDDMMAKIDRAYPVETQEDVIAACGLDSSRAYFSFDSAALSDDDRQLLTDVGRCLTNGRLLGRSILVIGYTDKIGPADYNLTLGMTRGEAVAKELTTHGVLPGHVFVRSRGEGWATGTTADGRAFDRKVELRLVQREI